MGYSTTTVLNLVFLATLAAGFVFFPVARPDLHGHPRARRRRSADGPDTDITGRETGCKAGCRVTRTSDTKVAPLVRQPRPPMKRPGRRRNRHATEFR
jgi:hypothetical protein